MKNVITTVQVVLAAIGGALGWFIGGMDGFMYALIAFVIADYLTGVMVAVLERKLSSDVGFRGIFKKVMIFVLVGIGHIIDARIIGDGSSVKTAIIFFYLSNEGISIVENACVIGLPVPQKLRDVLTQLRGEDKEGDA